MFFYINLLISEPVTIKKFLNTDFAERNRFLFIDTVIKM